jgi:hypothetical protein
MGYQIKWQAILHYKIGYFVSSIFIILSFFASLFSQMILPAVYLRDSDYIIQRIDSRVTGVGDSFESVSRFYSFLGLAENSVYVRFFQWCLFFLAFQLAVKVSKIAQNRVGSTLVTALYFTLIPFYGSVLTKEVFMITGIALFLGTLLFLDSRNEKSKNLILKIKLGLLFLLLITFGFTFRDYYFIVPMFMLIYFYFDRKINSASKALFLPPILIAILATVDGIFSISSRLFQFQLFNIRLDILDQLYIVANTKVTQGVSGNSIIRNGIVWLDVYQQFIFPVKTFRPSLFGLGIYVVVTLTCIILLSPYVSRKCKGNPNAVLFVALFTTLLIFEPDLGSFARHSFVWFPIALLILAENKPSATLTKKFSSKFTHGGVDKAVPSGTTTIKNYSD